MGLPLWGSVGICYFQRLALSLCFYSDRTPCSLWARNYACWHVLWTGQALGGPGATPGSRLCDCVSADSTCLSGLLWRPFGPRVRPVPPGHWAQSAVTRSVIEATHHCALVPVWGHAVTYPLPHWHDNCGSLFGIDLCLSYFDFR